MKENNHSLRYEIKTKAIGYILAAFGFVAGLAWNDAMTSFIDYLFPGDKSSVWAKWVYALFVTFVVVVGSFYLSRMALKVEDRKKNKRK